MAATNRETAQQRLEQNENRRRTARRYEEANHRVDRREYPDGAYENHRYEEGNLRLHGEYQNDGHEGDRYEGEIRRARRHYQDDEYE